METSDNAIKTRERLFGELKSELELAAQLEEQHLFPVLKKHKQTKNLVQDALSDNKQTRKLLAQLGASSPKFRSCGRRFSSMSATRRRSFCLPF